MSEVSDVSGWRAGFSSEGGKLGASGIATAATGSLPPGGEADGSVATFGLSKLHIIYREDGATLAFSPHHHLLAHDIADI